MDRFIWQILSDRTYKPNTGNCDGEEGIRGTNLKWNKMLIPREKLLHCLAN